MVLKVAAFTFYLIYEIFGYVGVARYGVGDLSSFSTSERPSVNSVNALENTDVLS